MHIECTELHTPTVNTLRPFYSFTYNLMCCHRWIHLYLMFNTLNTRFTEYIICFNNRKSSEFCQQSVLICYIQNSSFTKNHYPVGHCCGTATLSLWSRHWIYKYYLDEWFNILEWTVIFKTVASLVIEYVQSVRINSEIITNFV
jgi:hypothetical protein